MTHEEAKSSKPTRGREALLGSSARMRPLAGEKDPPPYGAQHRQDALWEGGNEALPPLWYSFTAFDGSTRYQDDILVMNSLNRPLPGVRLDVLGQLVDKCEWHISPLGRSYFINHNTRSTSWKKPTPERPAGSLMPECIIEGHSKCIWSLACLGTSRNILSASGDCLIRRWKRDGEPVGKPLDSHGAQIGSMCVSPDETMVVSGSPDRRLRMWNMEKGNMVGEPWEGHSDTVRCLDWSPDALKIASGSEDGTIRCWNPDNGRQITPPIEAGHGWVYAVKFSPQGDKLTSGGEDNMIRVWSKDGKLLIEMEGHEETVTSLCWSKDGAYVFSASFDHTIRKWCLIDGAELVTLRGHTKTIRSVCVSPNGSYLVSASEDCSVRIWDLKTNQQVGDPLLHDDELTTVVMSPDGKYIASAGKDAKIYVWNVEAVLRQQGGTDDANADPDTKFQRRPIRPRDDVASRPIVAKQPINSTGVGRYDNDFFDTNTNRSPPPHGSPLSLLRGLFGSLRGSTRLPNSSRSISRESRHWNLNLFFVRIFRRPVEVAPCREEDRYGMTPVSDAEAAEAIQRNKDKNETNTSAQPAQPVAGVQGSQKRPTEKQDSSGGTGEGSYEVSCCGFYIGRRRPTSHRS